MPWHIDKTSKCPASKPWGVIKDSDGSVAGCHPDKEKAKAQLKALYANVPEAKSRTVKELLAELRLLDGLDN